MWNLSSPAGFQGLDPNKPLSVYQRNLPHWRQEGATYFVTFRLADSLPQSKLAELKELKAEFEKRITSNSTPFLICGKQQRTALESRATKLLLEEHARQVFERVERWLDQGIGSCVLRQDNAASQIVSAMHYFDGVRYELGCYVIMPNHIHAVVRPLSALHDLEDIVGSWKKHSSRRINVLIQKSGQFWCEEMYDRIIRDEEHLWQVIQYIGDNPKRARLPIGSCPRWIRPEWMALGWNFESQ